MTNETKHTPGPWWIANGYQIKGPHPKDPDNRERAVADVLMDFGTWVKEHQANASLIAAAPETAAERDRLWEANAELAEALRDCIDNLGDEYALPIDILDDANNALAKHDITAKHKGETG